MKAVKTYISVYPLWYRVIVFVAVPIVVIAMGVAMQAGADEASGYDRGLLIGLSAGALIYAEIFGEWFTLGEISARKGAFGDVVMSSPKGRLFVKRFAFIDAFRKVIGYPLIFIVQQLLIMIFSPASSSIKDGAFIGAVFAFGIVTGVWVIRKTKVMALRFLSLLATGGIVSVLGIPYTCISWELMKNIIGVFSVIMSVLFAFLSARSVIKNAKEDYYDE